MKRKLSLSKGLALILLVTFAGIFILSIDSPVLATSTNITTSADAFVDSNNPDTNYGIGVNLKVKGGSTYRTYLKFDLSSIPSGVTILSASLKMRSKTVTTSGDVYCWSVNDDSWTETGITYNNQPPENTELFQRWISSSQVWYSWTVTSWIQNQYAGDGIASFRMRGATSSSVDVAFYSREYDSYDPYLVVTYSYTPTNNSLNLTNPSIGTQGVLAEKQAYIFQVKVTDQDGGSNINYVDLTLDYGGQNLRFRWTESSDTFSEQSDPNGYVSISSTSADSTLTGNQWTLDFKITFDWGYPDENLHTVRVYSLDDDSLSDTDDYSNIYYVENDLESYNLNVDDTRVNPAQSITFTGNLRYEGTSSIAPNDGDYNVKVMLSGQQKGIDNSLVSGAFSITLNAESNVASHSYTCEYDHMTGSGDPFQAVIVDRIEVYYQELDDSRVNIGGNIEFRVKARLDYDKTALGSGDSLTANIGSLTWDAGNGWFDGTRSQATVSDYTFQVTSGSESTYGITTIYVVVSNPTGVWDRIEVYYQAIDDSRVDINTNIEFRARARLDYDNHALGSEDSLTANFGALTWDSGNSWFDGLRSSGTVGEFSFQVSSGSEATYGITSLTITVSNPIGVWDRIEVYYEALDDSRVDVNTYIQFRVKARLDYDNHELGDGDTLTANFGGLTWDTGNSWFYNERTQASVGSYDFQVTAGSEATYGITTLYVGVSEPTGVWDRIEVYYQELNDSRVNINNGIEYRVRARLDYDDHALGSGDSITSNVGVMSWDAGNSWFDIAKAQGTVGDYTFQVNSGSEASYGITALYIATTNPAGVWDRLSITYSANTTSPVAGEGVQINVTATYAYDGQTVTFWYVNSQRNSSYFSSGVSFTDSSDSEVIYQYTAINASDNSYNITSFQANTLTVEWGGLYIEVYQITVDSSRVTINTSTSIHYHMRFSSNSSDVNTGTVWVNGTSYSINSTGWATVSASQPTVGQWVFWVTAVNINGETDWEQVPSNATVIWDKAIITLSASSGQVEEGEQVNVTWTVKTSYDSQTINNYLINITRDGQLILTNSNNTYVTESFSRGHSALYQATGLTDNTYGLTAFESNYITVEWESATRGGFGGSGGMMPLVTPEVVGEVIQTEMAQRGLWWLGGFLGLIALGGLVSASSQKRVSRKPRGTVSRKSPKVKGSTGARGKTPKGHSGGKGRSPRGRSGKRLRDKKGRFV